jgi:hypothetical protein
MTSTTPAARPAGTGSHRQPGARPGPSADPPTPEAAARVIRVLRDHPCWSAFWDKRFGVWRVARGRR